MVSLDAFRTYAEKNGLGIDAVAVMKDGALAAERHFSDETVQNVYSIAKSYLATAIGMAIDEGKLSLSDKPYEMFPEFFRETSDARWKDVTLHHLLTMTAGHGEAHLMAEERKMLRGVSESSLSEEYKAEWLLFSFDRPLVWRPGERFVYSNHCPYIAGRMLEKATGVSVSDYLYERLLEPLGIAKPRWDTDNAGHVFTASDLYLDVRSMAMLGQIYLGKGEYNGRRFFSEAWAELATKSHVTSASINPAGASRDEENGYGYYFWVNEKEGFRAYGKQGQLIVVLPEKRAVVAIQAHERNAQKVMDAMWETIYPVL